MRDSNPYAATEAVAVSSVNRTAVAQVAAAAVVSPLVLNLGMGAADGQPEIFELAKWGCYAGEFLVLAIWLAWGNGPRLSRMLHVGLLGTSWTIYAWSGFALASPYNFFSYSHEQLQALTVAPLAMLIAASPLVLFARSGWGFETARQRTAASDRGNRIASVIRSLFAFAIALAFFWDDWIASDIQLAVTIGLLMGFVLAIVAPLLSIAFLRQRIHLLAAIGAFAIVSLPGIALAALLPIPGAGGAPTYAYLQSIAVSVSSLCPLVAAFLVWRSLGLRDRRASRILEQEKI